MNIKSNVTGESTKTQILPQGVLFGFLGVLAFSFTVPLTRLAVVDLDPTFVGLGRALVAAMLAAALLLVTRQPLPKRRQWGRLVVVGSGVIVGFPLFTSLALRDLPAADAAVIVGLLPAATAVMAVLRAGERPSRAFWGRARSACSRCCSSRFRRGRGWCPRRDTCSSCSRWSLALWVMRRVVHWLRRWVGGA